MSSQTAKYLIPYSVAGDTVSGLPTTLANMAARLDLLAGESGSVVLTHVANTAVFQSIVLSRTYPCSAGGPFGIVLFMSQSTFAAAENRFYWTGGWTGTSTTVTGFTIGSMSNVAGARTVAWKFIPNL